MALFLEREGDDVIVVRGEIDLATADVLEEAALGAPTDGELVLDLRGVTFFDSSGIRALVRLARGRAPAKVVLRDPSRRVERVLTLVGLEDGAGAWSTEWTSMPGDGPGAWNRFAATTDHTRRTIRASWLSRATSRSVRSVTAASRSQARIRSADSVGRSRDAVRRSAERVSASRRELTHIAASRTR